MNNLSSVPYQTYSLCCGVDTLPFLGCSYLLDTNEEVSWDTLIKASISRSDRRAHLTHLCTWPFTVNILSEQSLLKLLPTNKTMQLESYHIFLCKKAEHITYPIWTKFSLYIYYYWQSPSETVLNLEGYRSQGSKYYECIRSTRKANRAMKHKHSSLWWKHNWRFQRKTVTVSIPDTMYWCSHSKSNKLQLLGVVWGITWQTTA